MSALSSAELRRWADVSAAMRMANLNGDTRVAFHEDEARALADALDQDQEALWMAEEALQLAQERKSGWIIESRCGERLPRLEPGQIDATLSTALAQIRARRKG